MLKQGNPLMATQQQLDTQAGIADLRVKYEHLKKIITIKNTFQKQQNFLLFNKSHKQDEIDSAQSIQEYTNKVAEKEKFLQNRIIEIGVHSHQDYFQTVSSSMELPQKIAIDHAQQDQVFSNNTYNRRLACENQLRNLESAIKASPIYLKQMTDTEMDHVIQEGINSMVHTVLGVSNEDANEIAQAIEPSIDNLTAKMDQIENIADLRPQAEHLEKILQIQNAFQKQQNFLLFNKLKNEVQNIQNFEDFTKKNLELENFNINQGITYEKYTNDKTNPFHIKSYDNYFGSNLKTNYTYTPNGETRRQAGEKYIASLEKLVQASPIYIKNMTDIELDTVISKGIDSMVHAVAGVSDEDANEIAQASYPTLLSKKDINAKLDQIENLTGLREKYEHLNKIVTIKNAFVDQQNLLLAHKKNGFYYPSNFMNLNSGIIKTFNDPLKLSTSEIGKYENSISYGTNRKQAAEKYIQYLEKSIQNSPVFLKNMTDSEMDNVIKQGKNSMVHAVAGISYKDADEIANASKASTNFNMSFKEYKSDVDELDSINNMTYLRPKYDHLNKVMTIQNIFAQQQNFLLFHKLENEIKNISDSNIRNQKLIEKQNFNFQNGFTKVDKNTPNTLSVYVDKYPVTKYGDNVWIQPRTEWKKFKTYDANPQNGESRYQASERYIQELEKAVNASPIFVKNMTDAEMDTVIQRGTETMIHAIAGLSYEDANSIASATCPNACQSPIYASVL